MQRHRRHYDFYLLSKFVKSSRGAHETPPTKFIVIANSVTRMTSKVTGFVVVIGPEHSDKTS